MTQNNNYATQKLLESLFGRSQYEFKNLNEEERKALQTLGYSTIDWDIWLSEGKATKEDVHKRVAIHKQLLAMDEELQNRKPKKEPRFKKWQIFDTKDRGKVLITKIHQSEDGIIYYHITDEKDQNSSIPESNFLKILK